MSAGVPEYEAVILMYSTWLVLFSGIHAAVELDQLPV
jgi:hypothetical protein